MSIEGSPCKTDHLKKTLLLKNSQIHDLLQELKQTQELCSNLKANFHKEEAKFKEKTISLENALDESKKQYQTIYEEYNKLNEASIQEDVNKKVMIE